MNFAPREAAPPEPTHHVCASGAAWCSGVVPCQRCFAAVTDNVLSRAIVQAVNGSATYALYELVTALRMRGMDPAMLGVRIDLSRFDPNEQVRSAIVAFAEGYRQLQARLHTMPEMQAALVAPPPPPAPIAPAYPPPGYGVAPQAGAVQESWPGAYGGAPQGAAPGFPSGFGGFDPAQPPAWPYPGSPPGYGMPVGPTGGVPGPVHVAPMSPPEQDEDEDEEDDEPVVPPAMTVEPSGGFSFPAAAAASSHANGGAVLGSIFGAPAVAAEQPPKPNKPAKPVVPVVPLESRESPQPSVLGEEIKKAGPLSAEEIALAGMPLEESSEDPIDRTKNGAG